jgi:uncharacterized protein YcaQ
VATLHDLADYYRMSPRVVAPLVQNLVEEGSVPVDICCDALATELHALKDWLGLDTIKVEGSDRFSKRLGKAVC